MNESTFFSQSPSFNYIVVEGPIGVGKTTLVNQLGKKLQAHIMLEQFEKNPFLPLFYKDPQQYSLQTELTFLMHRFEQYQNFFAQNYTNKLIISDYSVRKTRIFAKRTLSNPLEWELFEKFYNVLFAKSKIPNLIIYLHAPTEILLQRISARGRSYETSIDAHYLDTLSKLYEEEFALPPKSNTAQILSIDTSELDFRKEENVDQLINLLFKQSLSSVETVVNAQNFYLVS